MSFHYNVQQGGTKINVYEASTITQKSVIFVNTERQVHLLMCKFSSDSSHVRITTEYRLVVVKQL